MNSKKFYWLPPVLMLVVVFSINTAVNIDKFGQVSQILTPIIVVLVLSLAVTLYFIPSIVADRKKHRQTTAIVLLNIFLGWTFIGWVVALIWAIMEKKTTD